MGRPKEVERVLIKARVLPGTDKQIRDAVKKGTKVNTIGKVIDQKFKS